MKFKAGLVLLMVAGMFISGCSKKEDAGTTPSTGGDSSSGTVESTVAKMKETAKATAETVKAELEQTVANLKTEAAKLDVESLQQKALAYKDVITEKQGEVKAAMDKLAAIPVMEKMGTEAQKLTADIKTLTDSISALTERFNMYKDVIQEKGGEIKDLILSK